MEVIMGPRLYSPEETTLGASETDQPSAYYILVEAGNVGTGGFWGPHLQPCFESRTHSPILHGEQLQDANSGVQPPSDQLNFIRQVLKLNMSDLASVMGVSRPTIYAWLDGDEPSSENYTQIARLKGVANEVERLAIARCDRLMKRPIFEGRSFLDKLKAREEDSEDLLTLKQLAEKEESARGARKGSGKSRKDVDFFEHSTPIYESS